MIQDTAIKRRRGGQPGNRNSKNNRGNKHARGTKGNRGGKGAPLHNRNAYKPLTLAADLRREFRNCPEALDWLRQNTAALNEIEVLKETELLTARYGFTPEYLAETGQEYRSGVFSGPEKG